MLIDINIPNSRYSVEVNSSIDDLKEYISNYMITDRAYLITDSNVGNLYGARIKKVLREAGIDLQYYEVSAGEQSKNLKTAEKIIKDMCNKKIERDTTVLGFGGGVIGDLAGFVASIYMRGIPFINIPTSLIAQVDSSIGGKTGVNLSFGKNLVGTFYQPRFVYTDTELLDTLEKQEYRSGLGEVIKHAVIKGEGFFEFLEKNRDDILKLKKGPTDIMVAECIKIKGSVVVEDEKEEGLRKILNLGHTFGHAIEAILGYGQIKHGDGVSIGMVAAVMISKELGLASEDFSDRLASLLENYGLPIKLSKNIDIKKLVKLMYMDKKVRNSKLQFVLPVSPGDVKTAVEVPEETVIKVARELS